MSQLNMSENENKHVFETYKYSMTIKVSKPNSKGIRDIYGEFTAKGNTNDDFKSSIQVAMAEFMKQLD